MEIDQKAVQKIANLARLKIEESQAQAMQKDLGQILSWVEQLSQVNTKGVEPMYAVNKAQMPQRDDIVDDGGDAASVVANAPVSEMNMFVVPKVVE